MQLSGYQLIIFVSVLVTHLSSSFRYRPMKGDLLRIHPYTPAFNLVIVKTRKRKTGSRKGLV